MKVNQPKPTSVFCTLLLFILFAGLIAACETTTDVTTSEQETSAMLLSPTTTNTATYTPSPTSTSTLPPTATATSTNTPEPTSTSTPACLRVLSPQDGTEYAELGEVRFEWEKVLGAAKYRLEMVTPMETKVVFETFLTNVNRYLILYPWGGTYTWKLTAIGSNGGTICGAGPFSFTKMVYAPTLKATPGEKKWRRPPPSENCG